MTYRCGLWIVGTFVTAAACGGSTAPAAAPTPAAPSPLPPQRGIVSFTGNVYDSAFRPIAAASVAVVGGTQPGESAVTDSTGAFGLAGEFNTATQFRARKDGYRDAVHPWRIGRDFFFLVLNGPSLDLSGRYVLTTEADESCTELPPDVRRRSYDATVSPNAFSTFPSGTTFIAQLAGPGLDKYFHFVSINVAGDYVYFDMSDNGIGEEVEDETYFNFGGVGGATATNGGTMISAAISGVIDYCVLKADNGAFYPCSGTGVLTRIQCSSQNNRLTLTRR